MTLSLCMIVKNEEKDLPRCLESVKHIVDEIIIVDTGSTDSTTIIAEQYGSKVYNFNWNNNFSDARNYSLEQATSDWILLMDADDALHTEDSYKLLQLLDNTDVDVYYLETHSYVGDKPGSNVVVNLNPRLVRNHKNYRFEGAIHEQLICHGNNSSSDKKAITENVRFLHYGYLNKNIEEKQKRSRNMSIIEEELKNDKADHCFMFYCMGNEYEALGNYNKSIEYYSKALETFNPNLMYSPKIFIRYAIALEGLSRYNDELKLIETGLRYYPSFTDLEYLRGCNHHLHKRYTLAIKSFITCIAMGEAPDWQKFAIGVGTYKAYHALSEIYLELEDYSESYLCCTQALKCKPDFIDSFYTISKIFFKTNSDTNEIKQKLEEFFTGGLNGSAYITLADIFFSTARYEIAYDYILKGQDLLGNLDNILYFKGMCLLHLGKFEEAYTTFSEVKSMEFYKKSQYNMILCKILTNDLIGANMLLQGLSEQNKNDIRLLIYQALISLVDDKSCKSLSEDNKNVDEILSSIFDLLSILIQIDPKRTFIQSLKLLNLVQSNSKSILLGKLYYKNGYYTLALSELTKSIIEYNKTDVESLNILQTILQHINTQ